MIKKIKKYLEYQAKNIIKEINEILYEVAEYKYEKSFSRYNKLLDGYKNFDLTKSLKLKIINLHFLFIFQNFDKFFIEFDDVIKMINEEKKYSNKYKSYDKGFLYNLKLIIYLILREKKLFEEFKETTLNSLNIKMTDDELNVFEYKYPIYDENKIKEFFKQNRHYDNISFEKKEFVIKYLKNITEEIKQEISKA